MKDRLKVAWICPLDFTRFKDRLEFFEKPVEVIAPWMTLLTEIFEAHTDETELHVITAPPRLLKDATFIENGITYHFISDKLPLIRHKQPFILKKVTHYRLIRYKARQLVGKIQPDVVDFHGAEHDLAWSFFDLDYPKMLTPQYFVNNYFRFRKTNYLRYWMHVEKMIYNACRHFSYRNEHMKREIRRLNPNAILHLYQYPIRSPQIDADNFPAKDADLVFSARLIKSKGIEDLFHSIAILKNEMPEIRAKIIGQCAPDYYEYLIRLMNELGINNNVKFLGFLSTQEEMFLEVARSKLSVLPTHFDLIPGTVIEAMFIGTPVIAYASGGLPELNRDIETLRLVETGNIQSLSKEILALLSNPAERKVLASNARRIVRHKFNNELIYKDMINAYRSVIDDLRQ